MEEQQGPRSYVPQPTNQVTIQEGQITYDNELAIDLVNSTPKFLVQIFNSKKTYSKNIVSCPLAIIVKLTYKENQRVRTIGQYWQTSWHNIQWILENSIMKSDGKKICKTS